MSDNFLQTCDYTLRSEYGGYHARECFLVSDELTFIGRINAYSINPTRADVAGFFDCQIDCPNGQGANPFFKDLQALFAKYNATENNENAQLEV